MVEYIEKVRADMAALVEITNKFNEKFKQVVGDGENRGLWLTLNDQHQLAIRDLRVKKDQESLNRLNTIVIREKNVLESCKEGLKFYANTLENISDVLAKFFKVKSIGNILWYIRYVALLLDNIQKIRGRIEMEEKEINVMLYYYKQHNIIDPYTLHQYYNMLEQERNSFASMVDKHSIDKISLEYAFLNTLRGNINENSVFRLVDWLLENTPGNKRDTMYSNAGLGTAVTGTAYTIIGIIASVLTAIIDPIAKLSVSMVISTQDLNKALEK